MTVSANAFESGLHRTSMLKRGAGPEIGIGLGDTLEDFT
jgi:hypothetical protein